MVKQIQEIANRLWVFSLLLIFVSGVLAFQEHISRSIGYFFPVISPTLTITSVERVETDDGSASRVAGYATKLRGECSFEAGSLAWYLGRPDGLSVRVPNAYFEDRPQVRGEGVTEWTGIIVGLEPWEIKANSFSTVRHVCPLWPWPITSTFYQSEVQ